MTKTVLDEIKHALMAAKAVQGEQEFCVAWLARTQVICVFCASSSCNQVQMRWQCVQVN